jgi:DNA-binding NarL/FixJ family response regulator
MTDSPNIRVLIADDQRAVRDGLVMLVNLCDGIEVVGAAANGREAIRMADRLGPDVVLMDLRMPDLDGTEATRHITENRIARVVVLTTYADDESIFPALRAGAAGYLTKDASGEEIEAAIRAVHAGQTSLDPSVQARLIGAITDPIETTAPPATRPDNLTARELEVLALIGEGLSNTEICVRLFLGQATVKTHINRIFAKTGVRDRAQAVRYAISRGLADPAQDS